MRIGQPLAEARSLRPRAVFLPSDEAGDREALRRLALECQRFSPLVGLEEGPQPSALLGLVDGCTHLWGGEEPFLRAVRAEWLDRGYRVHVALAGSPGAARALARAGKNSVVAPGEEAGALSPLPVHLLRLPDAILERLEDLGLRSIGDVLKLPREMLASRFGTILPRRLDQVLGRIPEWFPCERLKEPIAAAREWETPIEDRLALLVLCRELIRDVVSMADRNGLGVQELEGVIRTEGGPVTIEIRLVQPTRDEAHLARLLELQLERREWSGGVVAVRWAAVRLGRLEQDQARWFDDEADPHASREFHALIDRLTSRLESRAVLRVRPVPDAQPEHAVRLVPWTDAATPELESFIPPPDRSRGRPTRLLEAPQPIDVTAIVSHGPPVHMVWRGRNCPVVRAWGPERIATGWWRAQDIQRDYYRVEWEQGSHAWVYRDLRSGRWFLHGFFD